MHNAQKSCKPMILLMILLFTFWVVLSGKFDLFHLGWGAASAVCIALGTRRLLVLPPPIGSEHRHPMDVVPWGRLLVYMPWLAWQIFLSAVQVALVVLHPKMPIQPSLIRFRVALPHVMAQLTLSTSITMTPGTITLDVQDDEFLVHALTHRSASDLLPPHGTGAMQDRVASLYASAELTAP
jgi:multicomponent Na+:H+ antiporter subunit E